jgi:hypothetical protein
MGLVGYQWHNRCSPRCSIVAGGGIIMNKGRYREAHEHRETSSRGLNYYLLAAQPLILQPRHGEIRGEYVLADAVLREAIREYQKFARYQSRRGVKLFRDVDQWFLADDRDSCFSFINICQVLDLEPTYIRTGLKMWRERIAKQNGHERTRAGNANGSPSFVAPV